MLTFSDVIMRVVPRRAAWIGAVLALSAIGATPSLADTLWVGGCTGGWGAANCVSRKTHNPGDPYIRVVPQPEGDAAKAAAAERDRKWLDRCQPVIAQDRYGVPRYHYAAPGCAFGVIE